VPRSPYQRKMPAADEGVAFALSLSPPIRGMSGYGMVAASAKARDAKQSTGALTCSLLGRERASGHGKSLSAEQNRRVRAVIGRGSSAKF
jgi:hypothetical protein